MKYIAVINLAPQCSASLHIRLLTLIALIAIGHMMGEKSGTVLIIMLVLSS